MSQESYWSVNIIFIVINIYFINVLLNCAKSDTTFIINHTKSQICWLKAQLRKCFWLNGTSSYVNFCHWNDCEPENINVFFITSMTLFIASFHYRKCFQTWNLNLTQVEMKTVKYKKTVYTLQQLHMYNTVQPAS